MITCGTQMPVSLSLLGGRVYPIRHIFQKLERKYKNQVKDNKNNLALEEAWDELEKSIIANIADDIQVGVNANQVEIVVIKEFLN